MPPRSYIEAMDRPTVLYILYTMVSAHQTNLCLKMLCEMTHFCPKRISDICDHFAILKFLWLCNTTKSQNETNNFIGAACGSP